MSRPYSTGWSNWPWVLFAATFIAFTGPRAAIWLHDTLHNADDALDCWGTDE